MKTKKPSKAALAAMREERIMDFCINHANQIIGELRSSGADNSEDIEVLEGLIETWSQLWQFAQHEADTS